MIQVRALILLPQPFSHDHCRRCCIHMRPKGERHALHDPICGHAHVLAQAKRRFSSTAPHSATRHYRCARRAHCILSTVYGYPHPLRCIARVGDLFTSVACCTGRHDRLTPGGPTRPSRASLCRFTIAWTSETKPKAVLGGPLRFLPRVHRADWSARLRVALLFLPAAMRARCLTDELYMVCSNIGVRSVLDRALCP